MQWYTSNLEGNTTSDRKNTQEINQRKYLAKKIRLKIKK